MPGNPNYVQLPIDGSGKKLQTWSNVIGSDNVQAEAVVQTDSTGTEKGTVANPQRVDPTGTTIQPVSGTVAATQGTSPWVEQINGVQAVVNAGNSSTAALNAGLSFTGTPSIDLVTLGEITIQVQLLTDQPGTLQIQFSPDNTNWDHTITGTVIANESASIATGIHGRYVRVVVTNTSASNQTFMRLQTILVPGAVSPTIKDLDTVVSSDDNAMVVHAVVTGVAPASNGVFANLSVRPTGALEVVSDNSVTGDFVVATKRNQFDVNFSTSDATDATLITNTVTGSGAITQANGQGIYATGTGAAGQAKGVTIASIVYRPSCDIYGAFTAAFTTPTDANAAHDYQRIGMYDTNNGFFVGYEGTVFGLTMRRAAVDTRVTLTNFNLDKLDGLAGSKFTRLGIPEAANFTFLNLFRIRFSWFGAANIYFDMFSPDGDWIPFHVIRYPNTASLPSIASPALPITVDVFKTSSDATNLQVKTGCWAGGVSESAVRMSDPIVDATLAIPTRAVIVGHTTAGGGSYINVKVNPSGALTAAVTAADGDVFVRSTAAATFPVTATQGPANATPWNENVAQWAGTAVSAPPAASTPPTGAEVAPVIRPILRKVGSILSTANLAGAGVFTSPWVDTNATGDVWVYVAFSSDHIASSSVGCQFQTSDDTSNTATQQFTAFGLGIVSATQAFPAIQRYWRVVYTNGATFPQTTFELTATGSTIVPQIGLIANNFCTANGVAFAALKSAVLSTGGAADGATTYLPLGHGSSVGALAVGNMVYTGGTNATTVFLRTPSIFKSVTATASGNTAVWTPTTGKKFRLMRYKIEIPQDALAAAGADLDVTLQDATTDIGVGHTCFIPAAAATTFGSGYSSDWIDLGNGKLSAVANNVLNINLSFALTGSKVRIMVCGTEE